MTIVIVFRTNSNRKLGTYITRNQKSIKGKQSTDRMHAATYLVNYLIILRC